MIMENEDTILKEMIALLRQMIQIPSYSREEKEVADLLENYLICKGYHVNRHLSNVWVRCKHFSLARPTLLLNSHLDTVKPAGSWHRDPFDPGDDDKAVFGLGSNDAGAPLVSLLAVFLSCNEKIEMPYNLIFAASAEEEVSGKNGIESILDKLGKVDLAIVGEPTGMNMAVAEKGLLVLDCTARGKSGHAARDEGENAIYKALEDIQILKGLKFSKVSDKLGKVKLSVTQINAGTQHNVTPGSCDFVVDIRSNELYSNQELFSMIKGQLQSTVKARSIRLGSSGIPENHPIMLAARKLKIPFFGSPTLSDQALMPFHSVKIGPGESARSHSADEFIYIEEIRQGIKIYKELLKLIRL
jgi:acetylornithine deacetylase